MTLSARRRIGQAIRAARTERSVVALGALKGGMRSVQGEAGTRMVKGCPCPIRGAVALLARCRESSLHVVRAGRSVEVRLVAGVAGGAARQVISTGRAECGVVALSALQGGMRTCQREACCGVVKGCAAPVSGVVTLQTGLREVGLHVVRIRRALEIGHVACDTGRRVRQVVCAARAERGVVALSALQGGMRTRQREARCGVVKGGAAPVGRVVAVLTALREVSLHVVRARSVVEIGQVARDALRVVG